MKSKIFWGIFFLAAAIFLVAMQITGFQDFGFWSTLLLVLLVSLFLQNFSPKRFNFFGFFIPLAGIYLVLEKPLNLYIISFWALFLSAIFLSIGFEILFGRKTKKMHVCFNQNHDFHVHNVATANVIHDNEDYPTAKVSFGATTKYLHGQNIKEGRFEVSLGSLEVYLDQAVLAPEGAVFNLDCSLGTIVLYVPAGWKVIDKIHASLGGIEHQKNTFNIAENAPVLTLAGSVSLGSIEIKYI